LVYIARERQALSRVILALAEGLTCAYQLAQDIMTKIKLFYSLAAAVGSMAFGAAATAQTTFSGPSPDEKPPGFQTSTAPVPPNAKDMQAVLDAQAALGSKPIETLTPAQARMQPTPSDGAMAVMKREGLATKPDPAVLTRDLAYGSDPMEIARIYKPVATKGKGPLPIVVYYHGGGWVIADLKTYDATPRFLAKQLNAIVVSVEYRHAPEFKFPAQHEDAANAYAWVLKNAVSWKGDLSHIALAGESAGGNLAVATAIYARDHGLRAPVHILAVYPIANTSMTLPSRSDNASTKPLNTPMLSWFSHYYASSQADMMDPRINLVAADLHGLPPTTIINAANDPLRSDGETLDAALTAAGDKSERRVYPGVTHEFFGMGKVVRGAYQAENFAVMQLKPALGE